MFLEIVKMIKYNNIPKITYSTFRVPYFCPGGSELRIPFPPLFPVPPQLVQNLLIHSPPSLVSHSKPVPRQAPHFLLGVAILHLFFSYLFNKN
jgi:hypothetical protein